MLRFAKKNLFRNLNSVNQKLFWKTVHLLTCRSPSVPVLFHDSGKAFTSQLMFYLIFSLVSPLTFADLDTFGTDINSCPDDFLCTVEEMQNLDVSKSQVLMGSQLGCSNLCLKALHRSIRQIRVFPGSVESVQYSPYPKVR